MGRPAIFLDRDGTINVEVNYLHEPEKFEFEQNAVKALRIFGDAGYICVIITNQSGIGRGYYRSEDLFRLHRYMCALLEKEGVDIAGLYYCPHRPDEGCKCRKPSPYLIEKAISELNIDTSRSWMLGDKLTDVAAGLNAGINAGLILTGYGRTELKRITEMGPDLPPIGGRKFFIFEDLLDAALFISGKRPDIGWRSDRLFSENSSTSESFRKKYTD